MAVVVCMRWLDVFPVSYVHVLRNAVAASLKREHRFVCVTDNPSALDDDIESIELPDIGLRPLRIKHGCWPKLSILKPGLLPADEPTLYLDLDVMIQQDLDVFFDRLESAGGGFHALREWNPAVWSAVPRGLRPDRGVQGSILGFFPRQQADVFESFTSDPEMHCTRHKYDQDFLTETLTRVHYWPDSWTVSFKRHCLRYFPINKLMPSIPRPAQAKVVVFHGDPRPRDIIPLGCYRWGTKRKFGYGPVDWVREYWLRHDECWRDEVDEQGYNTTAAGYRLAG